MEFKKINLSYRGEKIKLSLREMRGINKGLGLMAYRNNALLFDFNGPVFSPIHSFFCKSFVAIWLDEKGAIVDIKIVKPWRLSVAPDESFSKLIEIPIIKKYEKVVDLLVGGTKKLTKRFK